MQTSNKRQFLSAVAPGRPDPQSDGGCSLAARPIGGCRPAMPALIAAFQRRRGAPATARPIGGRADSLLRDMQAAAGNSRNKRSLRRSPAQFLGHRRRVARARHDEASLAGRLPRGPRGCSLLRRHPTHSSANGRSTWARSIVHVRRTVRCCWCAASASPGLEDRGVQWLSTMAAFTSTITAMGSTAAQAVEDDVRQWLKTGIVRRCGRSRQPTEH